MSVEIHPDAVARLREFKLPEQLGFGDVMAPVMFRAVFDGSRWKAGELLPYGPINLDPAAKVLHYAQSCFEGLKVYRDGDSVSLFRPQRNAARMIYSAERLSMRAVPETLFIEGVSTIASYCAALVPAKSGESLYLRPFLIGTQAQLGVTASQSYEFYVIASPSGAYHMGNMRLWIERESTRSAIGGTGDVKVGGNYASSLRSIAGLEARGFDQVLWLNPGNKRTIDELSGMNFFAVIEGDLHTPALNGSFLNGITRDSLLALAQDLGLKVFERAMDVEELLQSVKSGNCSEAFACGTAAIVSPISELGDGDTRLKLPSAPGPVAERLRGVLLDIQEGRVEDRFGWMQRLPAIVFD